MATKDKQDVDPSVTGFLDLLTSDMEAHPDRVKAIQAELLARAKELTEDVEIDHEAPIEGDLGRTQDERREKIYAAYKDAAEDPLFIEDMRRLTT